MKSAIIILAALLLVGPAAACGISAVCTDTSASFTGMIIIDSYNVPIGARLEWSTNNEGGSPVVAYYILRRWNGSAWTKVATVNATGVCSTLKAYRLDDMIGGSGYTYRLESWQDGAGSPSCYVDETP